MTNWIQMLVTALLVPLGMFVIGLIMAKRPPKRINHICGYRTARSMKSQAAWDFANVLSGKIWCVLGAALLIINTVPMLFVMRQSETVIFVLGTALCAFSVLVMIASPFFVEHRLAQEFDEKGTEKSKE